MKRVLAIVVVLSLMFGVYISVQTFFRITSRNISQVYIKDLETGVKQRYKLDAPAAENLTADLIGPPVHALPDAKFHSFELSVRNIWGYKKAYTVYFGDERKVFIRDVKTSALQAVEKPVFFHSHEGFDSLYPYRNPPEVEWSLSSKHINMEAESKTWSFRKLDGSWYSAASGSTGTNEAYKINTPDTVLSFNSDYAPGTVHLELRDEENQVLLEQGIQGSSIPVMNKDGFYHYLIKMDWSQPEAPYKGTFTYRFDLAVDLPASFEISKSPVKQGEVVKVFAYNVNENEVPVLNQTLFKQFRFYKNGAVYVGYLPTGYATPPGRYEIEYGIKGGQMFKEAVTIEARDFHIQHLVIDKAIEASTRNKAAYEEYDKFFKPVRLSSNEELYYSEPFVVPAAGRLSTEFGETRHVNGSPTSYRHSGLDIAAPTGTPVYAANRGKVVLSMFLTLTGNTVIIDHGHGLFSVYFHMNELFSEQGSIAERGQKIGTVGTTGFSTGPHLHFTMSYYERNVEPGYFLVGEPITRSNYRERLK